MNDLKTITWKRGTYRASLDEADELRRQIAADASFDMTHFEFDDYGDVVDQHRPNPSDVDRVAAARMIERWASVGARSRIAARRSKEHRALLDLLPTALSTLGSDPSTTPEILGHLTQMLRFARQMTPAICRYLATRTQVDPPIAAFDSLLRSKAHLNGWQQGWLQYALASRAEFADGTGAVRRIRWLTDSLEMQPTPTLRSYAAFCLARHGQLPYGRLLALYDRAGTLARPNLVAAIALTKPPNEVRRAVTRDSPLHEWVYRWALAGA